jgi:hypothetical protein
MGRPAVWVLLLWPALARGQDALSVQEVRVDPATLHAVGVQALIAGDDDRDASATVRVRPAGGADADWRAGPPLFRVLPETVTGRVVPEQLSGSLFDLTPGASWEVEIVFADPDGGGETRTVTATTRPVPRAEPTAPTQVAVMNEGELTAALAAAQPGDVITLADGVYTGSFFTLSASGTEADPIVIRGASLAAVVDGEDCTGCNLLEVYGSFVHVERLTFRNGERALRFLGATTGNVVRQVVIEDVVHGIGSAPGQSSFTICDNVVRGRLAWPQLYSDDGGAHADDQGIRVDGSGHVVCHNDIAGFGDPMINFADGGRAYDFYGNDIHEIYADGTELDRGEGNVRLFGNRFTNVFTSVSIQPAQGGPTYVLRNLALNVADEQVKLKSLGGVEEPSGVLVLHNTFVSPDLALNLQTPITQHNFVVSNNLFVGPSPTTGGRTVEWTAQIDRGVFDGNGYFPDDGYWFGSMGAPLTYDSLAEAQAAGVETSGVVLALPIFADGTTAPPTYTAVLPPATLALADGSNALDRGLPFPGINDGHLGTGPDLGAVERGCPPAFYGPRPDGMEHLTSPVDCRESSPVPSGDGGVTGDDGGGPGGADAGMNPGSGDGGGCGCKAAKRRGSSGASLLVWLLAASFGMKAARGRVSRRSSHARPRPRPAPRHRLSVPSHPSARDPGAPR